MTRRTRGVGVLVALLLILSAAGCGGPTLSSIPLPGAGVSGDTIDVTADFDEALNLADGAPVRVDGVRSGQVVDVRVHDFRARVTLRLSTDAKVRRTATARLRYTTPLGELFVDVRNPGTGALLRDGDRLPLPATSTAPTVEDTLASASLLINGGGLAQLQTITREANKALGGREGTVRDLLDRSAYLLGQLNESSGDIDRALHALDGASTVLRERRTVIHHALRDVRPAARVLRANLDEITGLLTTLDRFGRTANGLVGETRREVLALIRQAGPLLQELSSVRSVLPRTLTAIIEMAKIVDNVAPGDYLNLGTHLRLDSVVANGETLGLDTLLDALGSASGAKHGTAGGKAGGKAGGGAGDGAGGIGEQVTAGVAQELLSGLTGLLGGDR